MRKQIVDPILPYMGAIDRGNFYPGKIIRIQGSVPSAAHRFNINLQCGPETVPQSDVALQVAIHVLEGYISLNSSENEIWGEEELHALLIQRGKQFEIILAPDIDEYKVTLDGDHSCEYPQKIHYNRITYLAIDGDVSIFQISYESTSRNRVEGTPGHALREMLQSSASLDSTGNDSSAPPSYEAALDASKSLPYPTSDPVGMPYPAGAPGRTDFLPYPPADRKEMLPLPYRKIGIVPPPLSQSERVPTLSSRIGIVRLPSSDAPAVHHPPARYAPVSLNTGSRNVQLVSSQNYKNNKELCYAIGTIFGITVFLFFMVKLATGR